MHTCFHHRATESAEGDGDRIPSMTRTIGFIGAGNMAEAMIRGLLRGNDFAPEQVSASGPRQERVAELREKYGIDAGTNNSIPAQKDLVVLSVKPQILSRVLDEVADAI